jgi:NADPH:quinone reductase
MTHAHRSATLSLHEAAALPPVAVTAREAPGRNMVGKTDHMLAHGGVGGSGHAATRLAKPLGARASITVATCDAAISVKCPGAGATIRFREEYVGAYVDRLTAGLGFDVVIGTVWRQSAGPIQRRFRKTGTS